MAFDGDRDLVWEDEKVLEMDARRRERTQSQRTERLKTVKVVSFTLCLFHSDRRCLDAQRHTRVALGTVLLCGRDGGSVLGGDHHPPPPTRTRKPQQWGGSPPTEGPGAGSPN